MCCSLRINKGPTKGYEKDVGSKTTHRIMYPESAVDLDDSTHLVLFPFKIRDMQWLISTFTTGHITRWAILIEQLHKYKLIAYICIISKPYFCIRSTYTRVKSSIKAEENKVRIHVIKSVYMKYMIKRLIKP